VVLGRRRCHQCHRRHDAFDGHEVCVADGVQATGRPPARVKIRLIQELLTRFELVLWIDAAAVVDPSMRR